MDFEHSIATAVKKLRIALGDDADSPRYVETVPRYGYRLIVPVDRNGGEPHAPGLTDVASSFPPATAAVHNEPTRSGLLRAVAIAVGLMIMTGLSVWFFASPTPAPRVHQTVPMTQSGRAAILAQPVTDGLRFGFER